MNHLDVFKSIRVFEKNKKINIDYRLHEHLRGGKERKRFSTGIEANKRNLRHVESTKYTLAMQHYEQHKNPDSQTLLGDIALTALRSEASNRGKQLQLDYENLYANKIAPTFAKMRLADIKASHINQWRNDLISKGISRSRYLSHHTTFNMILKFCYINEYLDSNPMDRVSRKSKKFKEAPDKSDKYYTPQEVKRILEGATGFLKPLLTFLFHTGARTGEALALQWKFVDFEQNKITIAHAITDGELKGTKTNKVRVVDMTQSLKEVLAAYKEECISERWVFPSPKTGKPFYDTNSIVTNSFKKLLKELKIEYRTLYAARHSFASNLIAQNAPMPYVQKALGHASLSTTLNFYTKNGHISSQGTNEYLEKLYG